MNYALQIELWERLLQARKVNIDGREYVRFSDDYKETIEFFEDIGWLKESNNSGSLMDILFKERVGQRIKCKKCGNDKSPNGRSNADPAGWCRADVCNDYYNDPKPDSLWPGEKLSAFGYGN